MDSMLEQEFEDCKNGKKGVMPYNGGRTIRFVWHNGKGYGRECILSLRKEGVEVAIKLHKEIVELNKKG